MLWVVSATAVAQVVGWARGVAASRPARGVGRARLLLTARGGRRGRTSCPSGRLVDLLQASPTLQVAIAALQGRQGLSWLYLLTTGELVVLTVVAVVVGCGAGPGGRAVVRPATW